MKAKTEVCNCVLEDPTRGLQERQLFLKDLPSFLSMKKLLLIKRKEIIPADPKLATDIDTGLPAFLLDGVECMVKGDQVFQDGRRILLFSTDEHLQILARAREILGDGTFRITPHL